MRATLIRFLLYPAHHARLYGGGSNPRLTAFMTTLQPRQSILFEAGSPACDGSRTGMHTALDFPIALALRQGQDEPCPEYITGGQGSRLCPMFQVPFLFWSQCQQVSIIRHTLQTVETRFRYHWDTTLVPERVFRRCGSIPSPRFRRCRLL